MFKRYQRLLLKKPLLVNCVSTSALFSTGDVIAQVWFPSSDIPAVRAGGIGDIDIGKPKYDYKRTLRAAIYGGIIFAPIGDKWYRFLQLINVGSKQINLLARVAIDQLVFAPIAIPVYYVVMGVMESKSVESVKKSLKEHYTVTLMSNWAVWPAFQAVNFWFVPVELRLLSVNVVSIFWNTFLSYRNNK